MRAPPASDIPAVRHFGKLCRGGVAVVTDAAHGAEIEDDDGDGPSKSQRKRDADAVRDLGQRLAELGAAERAAIPLDDDVRTAIDDLNAIVKHGARKRQLGFLAKRLRRGDVAPIEEALERLARSARENAAKHHRLERWRERLLGEASGESAGEALTAWLHEHPDTDRQRLRQLQKRALAERAASRPPAATRELFRLLRDTPDGRDDEPETDIEGA